MNIFINHNLLLINRIINHNMINTTNVNIIFRIEEYKKLAPKMIIIEKNGKAWQYSQWNTYTWKKVAVITLGNNFYARKKNPPYSSLNYLRTQTRKIHLKSHWQVFNQNRRNHLLHLLTLNHVLFQLKLIVVLKLIKNQHNINQRT